MNVTLEFLPCNCIHAYGKFGPYHNTAIIFQCNTCTYIHLPPFRTIDINFISRNNGRYIACMQPRTLKKLRYRKFALIGICNTLTTKIFMATPDFPVLVAVLHQSLDEQLMTNGLRVTDQCQVSAGPSHGHIGPTLLSEKAKLTWEGARVD